MLDHIGCVSPGNAKPRPRDLVDNACGGHFDCCTEQERRDGLMPDGWHARKRRGGSCCLTANAIRSAASGSAHHHPSAEFRRSAVSVIPGQRRSRERQGLRRHEALDSPRERSHYGRRASARVQLASP
jgi:hypothetical protein